MNLWNFKANFYHHARRFFPFNLILATEKRNLQELFSKTSHRNQKVLDVGSGSGGCLTFLPENLETYALDSSLKMLQQFLANNKHRIVAQPHDLPFKSASFHLVTAIGVFQYLQQRHTFLEELNRGLAPFGQLILTYSQITFLNSLRFLLGHRLYVVTAEEISRELSLCDFVILAHRKSLIQRQLLIEKNAKNRKKT